MLNNDTTHFKHVSFPKQLDKLTQVYINSFIQSLSIQDKYARSVTNIDYKYIIREPNDLFKKQIVDSITLLRQILNTQNFKKTFINIPWKVYVTTSHVENALPHTHNDTIFIPETFNEMSKQTQLKVLLHEQIHVFQRMYPILTHKLFLQFWNLEIFSISPHSNITLKYERANPDKSKIIFTHFEPKNEVEEKTRFSKVLLYNGYTSNTPSKIVDSLNKKLIIDSELTSLEKPDLTYHFLLRNFDIHQVEHPNEVMASIIPLIVLEGKIHKETIDWMKQNF